MVAYRLGTLPRRFFNCSNRTRDSSLTWSAEGTAMVFIRGLISDAGLMDCCFAAWSYTSKVMCASTPYHGQNRRSTGQIRQRDADQPNPEQKRLYWARSAIMEI